MKNIIKSVALAVTLTMSLAAHADNYSFSYQIDVDHNVAAAFSGNDNGSYIESISDLRLSLNNVDQGFFKIGGYTSDTVKISNRGDDNDFWFANPSLSFGMYVEDEQTIVVLNGTRTPYTGIWGFVNQTDYSPPPPFDAPINYLPELEDAPFPNAPLLEIPQEVIDVPAVPEPETYAMMLAGLGVLGLIARRRKAA